MALRKLLKSSRNSATTLKEELQIFKHFLALEQLRFRDKLGLEIEVAKGLNASQIEIPSLLLQPYL